MISRLAWVPVHTAVGGVGEFQYFAHQLSPAAPVAATGAAVAGPREIVVRRPHEFKIACLQDIRALFPDEWNPFYAAFGNRDTDEVAYRWGRGRMHHPMLPVACHWPSLPPDHLYLCIPTYAHCPAPDLGQSALRSGHPSAWPRSSRCKLQQTLFAHQGLAGRSATVCVLVLCCREVGVPLSRTFTINPKGQIQKASTAVQSSTWSSLSAINDLVDEMFPALLQHNSSSINRALTHSTYTSFTETLELAASLGAIQQELVAAVFAEQQRRRSSSSGGGAVGAAKAAAAAAGKSGDVAGNGDSAAEQQETAGAAATPVSPLAAAAAAAAAADDAAALAAGAGALMLENVGPAREEYNDLHFWRPSFHVDIEEEMAAASAKQPQPVS